MSKSVTIGSQVLVYFVPSPIQNNQQAGPFHCKARSGVSHATLWGRVTNFSSFHYKSLCLMKYFQNFEKQLPNWLNLKNPMSISKLEIFKSFQFYYFSVLLNFLQYAMTATICWRIHLTSSILVDPTRRSQEASHLTSKENN